jgi:hypothetical protein
MKHFKFASLFVVAVAATTLLFSMAQLSAEYDLSAFGIPLKVSGPDGATLKQGPINGDIDGVMFKSAEIKKDYFILDAIMVDEEPEGTIADELADARAAIEEDETFDSYVLEEEAGYIAKMVDEDEVGYDFTYIVEKDGRHISFTQGITLHAFTMAEIKAMYAAAKSAN